VTSAAELRKRLSDHHCQPSSVWLVTSLKSPSSTAGTFVSRDEVLDELICFGWIDGIRRTLDTDRTMQLIGLRRRGFPRRHPHREAAAGSDTGA
jgi:hypothetical protein